MRASVLTVVTLALMAGGGSPASGQDGGCEALLRGGIFDEVVQNTRASFSENLRNYLYSRDENSIHRSINGGLLALVPPAFAKFDVNGSDGRMSNSTRESILEYAQQASNEAFLVSKIANTDVVRAFVQCREGLGGTIQGRLEDQGDPFTYVLELWYRSAYDNNDLASFATGNITVEGGSLEGSPNWRTRIGSTHIPFRIKRSPEQMRRPLIVNVYTNRGTLRHRVPGFLSEKRTLRFPVRPDTRSQYGVEHCGRNELCVASRLPKGQTAAMEFTPSIPPGARITGGRLVVSLNYHWNSNCNSPEECHNPATLRVHHIDQSSAAVQRTLTKVVMHPAENGYPLYFGGFTTEQVPLNAELAQQIVRAGSAHVNVSWPGTTERAGFVTIGSATLEVDVEPDGTLSRTAAQ